jgi:hypothetical protein
VANEIEITVRVKDEASAQVAAIADKVRAAAQGGSSGATSAGSVQRFGSEPGAGSAGSEKVRIPVEVDAAGLKGEVKAAGSTAEAEGTAVGEKISENLTSGFTRDSQGRLRDAFGRFASEAQKGASDAGAGIDDFEAQFRTAMNEADKVSTAAGQSITKSFGDIESASRTLRSVGSGLDDLDKMASKAGDGAANSGANFSFLYSKAGLLTQAALMLGPALAAIPAVMGAVAVGGATVALGLGGVIKALQDYGAQSAATGQSSAQLAATAFSNSVAIRNAEQAITDAKRQAAIQQQNSADSVAAAQQHLAQAQQSEQVATEALNQAWRDATNILTDLNNTAADALNGVADATLALQAAEQNAAVVTGSSSYTLLQKAQAAQAVIDAQQGLKDATQRSTEAQQAADDANAKGVAGSTAVVAAQRSQAQAAQGVTDAQHALVVAQRNAAEQQQASAEQISKAVQNLSDTYRQQQLAAAAAAASGSTAANLFAKDMAKLTQPGRDFVNQLIDMKTGAKELADTAQTSMLPGLTIMLKDSAPMLPVFNGAIQTMGGVIGNLAIQFGKLMESPAFRGQMTTVLKEGAGFAQQFGNGLIGMFAGVTAAAAKAGPIVQGLGLGFQTLMGSGIPALFSGLAVNASGAGQTLSGVLGIVSNLLGPIGALAGSLSGALGPAFQVLASPAVAAAFQAIANLLAAVFQILGPLVTLLANGLVGVLVVVTPLLQSLTKFLTDNHTAMTFLAGGILLVVAAVRIWNTVQKILDAELVLNPIGLLITAIAALVIGLIYCWEHFKGFRDFVHQMITDLHNWFFDLWHFLDQVWHAIPDAAKAAWDKVSNFITGAVTGAYTTVTGVFGKIIDFVTGLGGKLLTAGAHMWDWVASGVSNIAGSVANGFHSFINELIQGINWAIGYVNSATTTISDAWTWIPGAGGSAIPAIPTIPQWHAFGGVVGGLSAIIGDAGIEATKLPNGSIVMPHANTASMIAAGASAQPPAPRAAEVVFSGTTDSAFATAFMRLVRTGQIQLIPK